MMNGLIDQGYQEGFHVIGEGERTTCNDYDDDMNKDDENDIDYRGNNDDDIDYGGDDGGGDYDDDTYQR